MFMAGSFSSQSPPFSVFIRSNDDEEVDKRSIAFARFPPGGLSVDAQLIEGGGPAANCTSPAAGSSAEQPDEPR